MVDSFKNFSSCYQRYAVPSALARREARLPAAPTIADAARELLLLQICVPTFPIGAYTHSFGLETYVQLGLVHDEDSAREHTVSAAYGVFAALAGIDEEELLRRYLYGQVSAMVTSCVKTVPLSQTVGRALLFSFGRAQVEAVERALAADESLLGLSAPGFDACSIERETLYSRLYMS